MKIHSNNFKVTAPGKKIPVYGNGKNIRDWLFVGHHVEVLKAVMDSWPNKEKQFCVGGGVEISNIALIKEIWSIVKQRGFVGSQTWKNDVKFVTDRKGHDFRYAINGLLRSTNLLTSQPDFKLYLSHTIDFYQQNLKQPDEMENQI